MLENLLELRSRVVALTERQIGCSAY